ncbi:MAG TPA: DUF4258 domain-containing protein [Pyrinomonadaceae bacterium]|jgi:hypothetical protein
MSKPSPYDSQTAIQKIRAILSGDGYLQIRPHCFDQMGRRTVDNEDIRRVLELNGNINSEPEWDEKHQKYKYKVDGYDTEGDKLAVVVNIVETNWRVVAITAIGDWKEKKK